MPNQQPVELKVMMDANGNVQVTGPITNPILCYGMLEGAKDAIRQHQAKARESRIEIPKMHLPRGNGGL